MQRFFNRWIDCLNHAGRTLFRRLFVKPAVNSYVRPVPKALQAPYQGVRAVLSLNNRNEKAGHKSPLKAAAANVSKDMTTDRPHPLSQA
jgi:hypothetical protein